MIANTEVPVLAASIFAEYLPKLSVVSLYITISDDSIIEPANFRISIENDQISIPISHLKFNFEGIRLESEMDKKPLSNRENTFYFRLVAKPPGENLGSASVEIMPLVNDLQDEGLKKMSQYSRNLSILPEKTKLKLVCRNCSNSLGENIIFDKIRSLPAGNWAERANDMWFCHVPHVGDKCSSSSKESSISEKLEKLQIVEPEKKSIFEILQSPDQKACYSSSYYWAVNPCNLQNYKIYDYCKDSDDVKSNVKCCKCDSELGIRYSEGCIHLWDFGVKWLSPEMMDNNSISNNDSVDSRTVETFKRAVFASIYEWTYAPTCQFIVKANSLENSAFLWNTDRNLSIYRHNFKGSIAESCITIKCEKVAKFMYAEMQPENPIICNPFEQKLMKEAEKDSSQVLLLPDLAYKMGLESLKDTSHLYLTLENSLKSGFLSYNNID